MLRKTPQILYQKKWQGQWIGDREYAAVAVVQEMKHYKECKLPQFFLYIALNLIKLSR